MLRKPNLFYVPCCLFEAVEHNPLIIKIFQHSWCPYSRTLNDTKC